LRVLRHWRAWWPDPSDIRAVGEEPDYRFTLANERTFLAWIRTSLALLAGGVAVVQLVPGFTSAATAVICISWLTLLVTRS
jgi:putative membrane protein